MGWLSHNPEVLDDLIISFLKDCGYDYYGPTWDRFCSPGEMLMYLFPYTWWEHWIEFERDYWASKEDKGWEGRDTY